MTASSTTDQIPNALVNAIDCQQGAVRAVRFNVDGFYCLTCGSDKTVKLWNPHMERLLKTYSGHGFEVLDACASHESSMVASCGLDKTVMVFDVATGQVLRKYRGHAGAVNCVAMNEESTCLFSGSIDCTIKVWDLRSKSRDAMQVMDEAKDSVSYLETSDHEIIAASLDCKVRRYDIRMGLVMSDHLGKPITCSYLTKDGQCLVNNTADNTVKLIDKETGQLLNEYRGHKHANYRIESVLNNKDSYILSGSEDGKVVVWDLVDGKVQTTLDHIPGKPVHSLSFHPKENCLLTAVESRIYLWK